ncbi:MAG: hypothetical protein J0L53_16625, partial [Spirochaetes bacterium]|nr:hypothetical protein [Spirochaetota bacterium]
MKKRNLILSAALLVSAYTSAYADAPAPASDPTTCQPGSSDNCYLADKNAVNQPLDTQTRGLAVPNRLIESDMNMFVNPGQLVNYGTAYLEGWLGANLVWGGATVPMPANQ